MVAGWFINPSTRHSQCRITNEPGVIDGIRVLLNKREDHGGIGDIGRIDSAQQMVAFGDTAFQPQSDLFENRIRQFGAVIPG